MKTVGSSGKVVEIEIKGISEVVDLLRRKGEEIQDKVDMKMVQAANMLQQEIQESIIGNRLEPKSVDTGNFANSISVNKLQKNEYEVFTPVEYAKYLEYGTSKIDPRMHFRNSLARNQDRILSILKQSLQE